MHPLKISVSRGPPAIMPHNLIPKVFLPEDRVHNQLQIVACGGIAA